MMVTRSEIRNSSSIRWEIYIMLTCFAFNLSMIPNNCSTSSLEREDVGSSMTMIRPSKDTALYNLNHLLLGDRQRFYQRIRVDIDPEVCQHLACPAVRLPHIHGAEFRLDFPSQEQVLRDRQIRNQDDLLMYDSDSFLLASETPFISTS